MIATEAATTEAALVGCWVTSGWSRALTWTGSPEWNDDHREGLAGLVTVLVIREHRYGKLVACSYLVDPLCLGVKNADGPRLLEPAELDEFVAHRFAADARDPLPAPLDLGRQLVLGAEAYARQLGFQPNRALEPARGQLGAWTGPSSITFGRHGKPFFVEGPYDDALAIIDTLEGTVGAGNFDYLFARTRPDALASIPDRGERKMFSYQVPAVQIAMPAGPIPADAPRGNPTTPLSDSLLRVMEPYIPWPPAPDELDELGEELSFGAAVWNATAQSTSVSKTASLLESVVKLFATGVPCDDTALRDQVAAIAERKRRMCPDDPRQISRIDVVPNGRNVEVLATSAWYPTRDK